MGSGLSHLAETMMRNEPTSIANASGGYNALVGLGLAFNGQLKRFSMRLSGSLLRFASGLIIWHSATCLQAQTGTFIDRRLPTDLRVVSYNIYFDSIFPSPSRTTDEKFARVIKALDPDILNLQEIYGGTPLQVQNLLNSISPLPNGASWQIRKGTDNVIASKYPFHTISATGGGEVIGLVDLPNEQFAKDFFFSNNHYSCCGGVSNDPPRQNQSDDIMRWIRNYRSPGGVYDLPSGTPFAIVGDLNIVGGPGPLDTLITGNIANETVFGSDFYRTGTTVTSPTPILTTMEPWLKITLGATIFKTSILVGSTTSSIQIVPLMSATSLF
jgi:hypothetical protein